MRSDDRHKKWLAGRLRSGEDLRVEVFVTTERLALRELTEADADNLYELDSDPEVMRLLTNGEPTPYPVIRDELLPKLLGMRRRSPAHGLWAAIARPTDQFVGWLSLAVPEHGDLTEAELGYRLRRSAWGKGYATEGSRALLRKAFTELGLRRVFAETMAVNQASRRVLEKVGMTHVRTFYLQFDDPIPGTEQGEVEYAITRADWEALCTASPSAS